MGVVINQGDDGRVIYADTPGGDFAALDGLTAISVLITVRPYAYINANRLCSRWVTSKLAWILYINASARLGVGVGDGTNQRFVEAGTHAFTLTGNLYRCGFSWQTSDNVTEIWQNGTKIASASGGTLGNLLSTDTGVSVGHDNSGTDGIGGVYSDFAIYGAKIPNGVFHAYGQGMSPLFWRDKLLLYDQMASVNSLYDRIGRRSVTKTGLTQDKWFFPVTRPRERALLTRAPTPVESIRRTPITPRHAPFRAATR